ncbi:MAG: hypothetical protein M3384_15945 [Acidobacteriota bacterium]|nr:hypothetical protein [Acidobacteriota bacterium]
MWTKIFLVSFAAAFAVMSVLTYLPYSWLQSKGFAPNIIAGNFLSYSSAYTTGFWISLLVLLILSNVVLWLSRRAWALWLTFLFFSIFVLIQTWWLSEAYASYARQNSLPAETPFGYGILGALICVAAGVGIFFNQFLVLRMRDSIHGAGKTTEEAAVVEESPRKEEDV